MRNFKLFTMLVFIMTITVTKSMQAEGEKCLNDKKENTNLTTTSWEVIEYTPPTETYYVSELPDIDLEEVGSGVFRDLNGAFYVVGESPVIPASILAQLSPEYQNTALCWYYGYTSCCPLTGKWMSKPCLRAATRVALASSIL